MAKGGEGSRGGHITGHTKGGKPIYGDHHDTAAKVDRGKPHGKESAGYQREHAVGSVERAAKGAAGFGAVTGAVGAVGAAAARASGLHGGGKFALAATAVGAAGGAAVGVAFGARSKGALKGMGRKT